jgi:hypothetical protein
MLWHACAAQQSRLCGCRVVDPCARKAYDSARLGDRETGRGRHPEERGEENAELHGRKAEVFFKESAGDGKRAAVSIVAKDGEREKAFANEEPRDTPWKRRHSGVVPRKRCPDCCGGQKTPGWKRRRKVYCWAASSNSSLSVNRWASW